MFERYECERICDFASGIREENKKFGLSLILSNRCFVPRTVQIDLLPVRVVAQIPFGPLFPTLLTADGERLEDEDTGIVKE